MIDFEEIKKTLVETGLAYKEMADAATQKIVFVEGEWNRDGSANIKSTRAGWIVGSFPKVIDVKISVPETSAFNKKKIEDGVQNQFPEASVIVRIK